MVVPVSALVEGALLAALAIVRATFVVVDERVQGLRRCNRAQLARARIVRVRDVGGQWQRRDLRLVVRRVRVLRFGVRDSADRRRRVLSKPVCRIVEEVVRRARVLNVLKVRLIPDVVVPAHCRYTPSVRGLVQLPSVALWAATAGLLACHPKALQHPEPIPSAPASSELTLDQIADLIDPGPQAPLSEGLPPQVFELLGLEQNPSASGAVLLEQSIAETELIAQAVGDAEDAEVWTLLIRSSARAVVLAEQAAQRGAVEADALAQLERAYKGVDVPALANDRNVIVEFIATYVAQAAMDGGRGSAEFEPLVQRAQDAMRSAEPLHRRTTAQLLRVAPDHDAVPTALLAVAVAELGAGHEWTIPAAKLALERRGKLASASEQLDLARICLEGLDVPCAEAAVRAAAGAEGSDQVSADLVFARRIVELADATTLEHRLERARAFLELERYATAKAEFEALHAEFPQDARPVAGLARHAVRKDFDFSEAHRLIESQVDPKNADEAYYELAIGTRMMAVIFSVLPNVAATNGGNTASLLEPVLVGLRPDIEGYAALGNTDGRFLVFVLDVMEELLAQYEQTDKLNLRHLASLSDSVVALQSEIPNNPHAYRVLMSIAALEPDKSRASTMVGVPAPAGPEHDSLVFRRARALVDLAVTWSDPSFAKQAVDALQEVDSSTSYQAEELRIDALMVQRVLGGTAAWETIWKPYQLLLDGDLTSNPRVLNNLGVAVLHYGGPAEARDVWELSSDACADQDEDHGDVGKLNLIVSASPDGGAAALAAMRTLAGETTNAGVRVTALAWVHAWSKGRARRGAQAALKAALDEAKRDGPRPTAPDPYSGLVLEGAFSTGLGYAEDGLAINFDGSGLPWAILAPPR